jgi:hypothetical protein
MTIKVIIDLTTQDDKSIVPLKRRITYVDLTADCDDETALVKRPKREVPITIHLMNLSRDLIKKIFEDYLNIVLIKDILQTPKVALRTSLHIHHAMIGHIVPKKATVCKDVLSSYILRYIGNNARAFISFAKMNATVVSSLKVNDTFDYYEPHRNGRYIVLKTLKDRAIVQKIKAQNVKLFYKGLLIDTVTKIAPKKSISFRVLNERCVFSSLRNMNVCFINNNYVPMSVSYFIDDVNVFEKRNVMSEYSIV